ncbi:hypothetical protein [Corynebacterium diphtheriae]|uniref:hypothetical protein n=1 Tax=Corynebacterium diphtheriae TaxID=1717 RepID=UPI0008FB0196|nr:hypothetical protein [Corynebacterium diphtheriae]OIR79850.1 hypothetical protein BHF83_10200 [Corynebacterium diphtheriae]OWX96614.1 hypothetical protein B1A53_10995 [Corynebacterium diphtheriae]CAB0776401.1 hypothetical protein FRC0151_01769 [Corynebacterium diphtheriae]CAB0806693.1 hypothetical protein FRC0209_01587 [Corynebacterium diphtheriae]CAB0868074.1 hypothetical protein FRC0323_02403 [Corynebacterium diphtheriae]
MADRKDVIVYADGGDMTVGRSIPVYVLGAFDVVLPEGREQEKGDDRVRNGYIYRPPTPAAGSLDVGFVKADVKLDFGAKTSSLERVVDAAIRRTEGDVFFERDIYQSGLGGFTPGRDFDLHDVIQVDVWGKLLPSPVTAIDYEGSVSQRSLAARVHVGGQMITDAEGLQAKTDATLERVEAEKRQRLKSIGAVSQQAASAGTAAAKADGKAVAAQETADDALAKWRQQKDQLDKVQSDLIAKNAQWNRIQDRGLNELAAQQEAMKRYVDLSKPASVTASTWDPVWAGPVQVSYPSRNQVELYLKHSPYIIGASVLGIARVNALSGYSFSFTADMTAGQTFTPQVGGFESFNQVSVTVHPIVNFAAILSEERRKRGLY